MSKDSLSPLQGASPRHDFYALDRAGLKAFCASLGVKTSHAETLFRQAYKALDDEPWALPGLPRSLATVMAAEFQTQGIKVSDLQRSAYDGSVKFALSLDDGLMVEAVLMPESKRVTLCVSSQVGCRQACAFCHTGRMGLKRHLSPGEIVGQVVAANRWIAAHPEWLESVQLPAQSRVTNVVFMGMGEPLDNVDATIQAIRVMTDPLGLNLALRRISVSTAGHVPGIKELFTAHPQVRLAVSLHGTTDAERSRIMPINRRWPLATLLATIRERLAASEGCVMIQYTLIGGVNDSPAHAERLGQLLAGLSVKVNLIPFNKIGPSAFDAPLPETVHAFRDVLHRFGLRVMVRYSKGQDIAAACGQLVVEA